MERLQLFITGQSRAALDALSRATGLSIAEHIRRAIDAYLAKVNK